MTRLSLLPVLMCSLALTACGDGGSSAADAAVADANLMADAATNSPDAAETDAAQADADEPDADEVDADEPDADEEPDAEVEPDAFVPPGSPSCDEFTTPITTLTIYPATYDGDLATAEANVNITDDVTCVRSDSTKGFGQVALGVDNVIALTGLTPGTVYIVKLVSLGDLGIYVITGCDPVMPGPGADQCLAYADIAVGDELERTKFTAPADGKAFVVVDFYSDEFPPDATAYSLSVGTDGCVEDADCPAGMPTCQPDATCQ